MNAPRARSPAASLIQGTVNIAWPLYSGKRGLIVLAIAVAVTGLAMNWSWLMAAGLAPILLGVLPCAAMCALGLCMNKMSGHSCSTDAADHSPTEPMAEPSPDHPTDGSPRGIVAAPLATPEPQPLKKRSTTDA